MPTRPVLFAVLLAMPAIPSAQDPGKLYSIRGRFVDAESGQPLRRVEVTLSGHASTGYGLSWSCGDWVDPVPQRTVADGRFRFRIRLPRGLAYRRGYPPRYHIHATHPTHLRWYSDHSLTWVHQTGDVDYGDIRLPKGARPRIRVLDTQGQPQPGVLLRLRPPPSNQPAAPLPDLATADIGPRAWVSAWAHQRTGLDGYLHLRHPIHSGALEVQVRGRKLAQPLASFRGDSRQRLEIAVTPVPLSQRILGRLIDGDGLPVAGARVGVSARANNSPRVTGTTQEDGRFVLVRRSPNQIEHANRLMLALNQRFDGWVQIGKTDWGQGEKTYRLPAKRRVTLLLQHPGPTKTLRGNLYCIPQPGQEGLSPVRRSGEFSTDRLRVKLGKGKYQVMFFPWDEQLAPSRWTALQVEDQTTETTIKLWPTLRKRIELRVAGRPAAGIYLALTQSPKGPGGLRARDLGEIITRRDPRQPAKPLRLAAGRTNAQGVAELWIPDPVKLFGGVNRLSLSLVGPGVQAEEFDITTAWQQDRIRIQAQPGVTLRGRILPLAKLDAADLSTAAERHQALGWGRHAGLSQFAGRREGNSLETLLLRKRPTLLLRPQKNGEIWQDARFLVDLQGRFEIHGIPPGRVHLALRLAAPKPRVKDIHLGSFTLAAGPAREVELRLPDSFGKHRSP